MERSNTKKIVNCLILSLVLIFFLVLIPYFLGFARTGFDDEFIFRQYMIYAYFGGIMLFGLIIVFMIEILIKEKDKIYGDGVFFNNQGDYPSIKFFGRFSSLQIFLFSLIIFLILGFANSLSIQQTFFQLGATPQQFTPTDSVIFRSLLIPVSENLGLAFVLGFFVFSLRYYARKKGMTKENFFVYSAVGVLVFSAIYGFGLHQIVYVGQDTSLLRTVIIWTVGGLLTFATGSFIPFWILHLVNNLFIDLKTSFSNEIMLVVFFILLMLSIVLYWFTYIKKSKKFNNLKI